MKRAIMKIEEAISELYDKNIKLAEELVSFAGEKEINKAAKDWTIDDAEQLIRKYIEEILEKSQQRT